MRVLILGGDGYLGFPTALHFKKKGHEVMAVDSYVKRAQEKTVGVRPLVELPLMHDRAKGLLDHTWVCDISDSPTLDITSNLDLILQDFQPDTIVHYAEQCSAPYSMMGRQKALQTQRDNVLGTLNLMFAVQAHCPDAHIIKLGTMGEYGTPNIPIEEGWLDVEHGGRKDRVLYPKRPGSIYHLSKVHDSANLEFGTRVWDLRVTDLNQGVVYGVGDSGDDPTSFHYDHIFGTVLNRFVVQAVIGLPLTVYGRGRQTRGFLNIKDTLACVYLAAQHPAEPGEFRVFNQFTQQYSVMALAKMVTNYVGGPGLQHIDNPRVEMEEHFYEAKHTGLEQLGLVPTLLGEAELLKMAAYVERYANQVDRETILPTEETKWRKK